MIGTRFAALFIISAICFGVITLRVGVMDLIVMPAFAILIMLILDSRRGRLDDETGKASGDSRS